MDRTLKPGQVHIRAAAVEVDETEDRTVRFIASDESVDRYGDVIAADGWQLKNFRDAPRFLWNHDYNAPIGSVPEIEVKGTRLLARAKFEAKGIFRELSDSLWEMVKAGLLNTVSVGFTVGNEKGVDYDYIYDDAERVTGYRYLRPELLELSLVTVPANPNAVALGRSLERAGKVSETLLRQALLLDASVREQQSESRRRIQEARVRGNQVSAPR
jgi:HK97 family phage prohead protease